MTEIITDKPTPDMIGNIVAVMNKKLHTLRRDTL
jgi:hypothetical protein